MSQEGGAFERVNDARTSFKEMWRKMGNMSDAEIEELDQLEHSDTSKLSVADQVRRYELHLKTENPELAEKLMSDIGVVDYDGLDEEKVTHLIHTIYKYLRGTQLYFDNKVFSGE